MRLTIDFETRSPVDIKTAGAAAYAEHPETEVICLAVLTAVSDPAIWIAPAFRHCAGDLPVLSDADLKFLMETATEIEAHNAQFEYFIWNNVMTRHGFDPFPEDKLRCSAAKAAYHGLPRDLASACREMGVSEQKDESGHRLMLKLCKPRRPRKAEMLEPDWNTRRYWYDDPEDIRRLMEYCMQDVRAEQALSSALPPLPAMEESVWRWDLKVNARGVRVDVGAVTGAISVIEECSERLKNQFQSITGLDSPTQRDATLAYLRSVGTSMDGLTKADVANALQQADSGSARQVLEIRQKLSRSSTAKYKAFLRAKGREDRIRGCFLYHGAGTGRWAGRLIQPQNFPRGAFSDVDGCIRLLKTGNPDGVEMVYGDAMLAASTCLRGMIIPADGFDFIAADYSSIEGRVLAYLAGEESALGVYRMGNDPYKVAASAIYGVRYDDVTKSQRQIGKVAELALGYQGAKGAFNAMASGYGVNLPEDEVMDIVRSWRASRPATVAFWAELETKVRQAVATPGRVFDMGWSLKVTARPGWLIIRLPSGRCLWYREPRMEMATTPFGPKEVIAYNGVDSLTRKWTAQYLYGGKIAENITQAFSRDVLVNGADTVEKAGYKVVLHVHDELVSEVPEGFGSVEEFENLVCKLPLWAEGLPLKAEGWRGKRYRK